MRRLFSVFLWIATVFFLFVGISVFFLLPTQVLPYLAIGLGVFLAIGGWLFFSNKQNNWLIKGGKRVFFVLFSVGIAVGAVVSSFMVWGPHSFHGTNFDGTVIVLGCKVRGDQPSLMLKARLDAAVAFLDQNPESLCIVSGGQGKDEQYPEAVVMKRYLVEQGIDSSRIFEEANSKNTLENLQFSQLLIQEKGLSENIVVITNYFHRYRGQLYAEKAGLKAQTVAGACRFDLEVCYWLREIPAVMKAWFS